MSRRITLQALGENDPVTRFLCEDMVSGAILWRIMLASEDEVAIPVRKICEAVKIKSQSVVSRRLQWLEDHGIIQSTPGSSKWDATTYSINYDCRMFVKKRTVKKGKMEVDAQDDTFDTVASTPNMLETMLQLFTEKNYEVHGKRWQPRSPQAKQDWLGACKKILEFEGMTPEKYASVVEFLAHQYKDYLAGNRYAMQVQSLPNLLTIQQNKGITKLESALDKMEANSNVKPDTPRNTSANIDLLKKRAQQSLQGNANAHRPQDGRRLLGDNPGGSVRSDTSVRVTAQHLERCLTTSLGRGDTEGL